MTGTTYATDAELLQALVIALDRFDDTINFWMSDEAWKALAELRRLHDLLDSRRDGPTDPPTPNL